MSTRAPRKPFQVVLREWQRTREVDRRAAIAREVERTAVAMRRVHAAAARPVQA